MADSCSDSEKDPVLLSRLEAELLIDAVIDNPTAAKGRVYLKRKRSCCLVLHEL